MKKLLSIGFIVMGILIALVSCKKSEDFSPAQKEEIRIFASIPGQIGLKSSLIDDPIYTKRSIKNGDTVDVRDMTDINLIFSAENQNGQPIDGAWSIYNIDNDRNIHNYDTISIYSGGGNAFGSIMSTKLKFLGLYEARFVSKMGSTESSFYVRHTGRPGATGDDGFNDYSFRLDKELYQVYNKPGHIELGYRRYEGYTVYLKYREGEFPNIIGHDSLNPSLIVNFHALVSYISSDPMNEGLREFKVKKSKYSSEYVCFSFIPGEFIAPNGNGAYGIYMYSGSYNGGLPFESIKKSNWSRNGQIIFRTI